MFKLFRKKEEPVVVVDAATCKEQAALNRIERYKEKVRFTINEIDEAIVRAVQRGECGTTVKLHHTFLDDPGPKLFPDENEVVQHFKGRGFDIRIKHGYCYMSWDT